MVHTQAPAGKRTAFSPVSAAGREGITYCFTMTVLPAGRRLTPQDIGALAALGVTAPEVCRRAHVAVLSTGDELVSPEETPGPGQVRDVNTPLLSASSYPTTTRDFGLSLKFSLTR